MSKATLASRRKEAGSATVQLLVYGLAGWVLLTALLRLLPIYIEHRTIISLLETTINEYDSRDDTKYRLREKLKSAWTVNGIDQVDVDKVRIERNRSGLTLSLTYDVRFPLITNISGVWSFDTTLSTE